MVLNDMYCRQYVHSKLFWLPNCTHVLQNVRPQSKDTDLIISPRHIEHSIFNILHSDAIYPYMYVRLPNLHHFQQNM